MKMLFKTKKQLSKKLFLIALMLFASFGAFAQISVNSYGDVQLAEKLKVYKFQGITLQLEPDQNETGYVGVSGKQFYRVCTKQLYLDGANHISDARLKENFRDIETPLEKIMLLKGQKYDFKAQPSDSTGSENEKKGKEKMKKDRLGFLAQEVEKVIPEVVTYEKDEDKYYLDYDAIIPVIVEAIKEQEATIQEQHSTINDLTARIEKLEGNDPKEKSATIGDHSIPATLSQNIPNPFNQSTKINMYLPSEITKATLYVYTLQGVQINKFEIPERGDTFISIEGSSLKAGLYLYTLIADGNEVDTKKMILTN